MLLGLYESASVHMNLFMTDFVRYLRFLFFPASDLAKTNECLGSIECSSYSLSQVLCISVSSFS